jgi:tetratricopeptide (TPR) repeat protein
MGNFVESAKTLEESITQGLQDPETYYNTALVYSEKIGDKKKALFYLQKALNLTDDISYKQKVRKAIRIIQSR